MNRVGVFELRQRQLITRWLMFGELVGGASAERIEHGIHNETMFHTPSSGEKTARIIDFMATKRQLKRVVGDPCCKPQGEILNAKILVGKRDNSNVLPASAQFSWCISIHVPE